jgi:hypothetical protein|tara:strand:- start:1583 stop:1765 length:183 start_codon:yes stop_codon:yes gene_type:complete
MPTTKPAPEENKHEENTKNNTVHLNSHKRDVLEWYRDRLEMIASIVNNTLKELEEELKPR